MRKISSLSPWFLSLLLIGAAASAQSPQLQKLTLAEAEKIAIQNHPLIQAAVFVIAAVVMLANLVVDLLYLYFDPRIRLE